MALPRIEWFQLERQPRWRETFGWRGPPRRQKKGRSPHRSIAIKNVYDEVRCVM